MSDIKLNFEQRQLASEYAETHDVSDEVAYEVIGLSARIEELERDLFTVLSRDIGEDIQEFNHAHGVYEITTEQLASGEVVLLKQGQIDKAWRLAVQDETLGTTGAFAILRELGIVACEECGGSGRNAWGSVSTSTCTGCDGHGWVWKEVTKDEQ